ncbi:MAG: ABC transporter substrate-binding protein [Dehalococcoidia bacterium]|nr:ABC transporter substrate-binding protein [Dehalococcoidia bacterium]
MATPPPPAPSPLPTSIPTTIPTQVSPTQASAAYGYGSVETEAPSRDVDAVIMAVREVGPVIGDPATGPYRTSIRGEFGIGDYLFMHQDGNPMTPMLASTWEISPDGSTVGIEIREGIPFNTPPVTPNMDYGELTADDVVWMMNRHNLSLNPRSSAGGATQFAAFFGEAKSTGKYSLEIPLVKPVFFGLPITEMGIHRAVPAVESKRAFELLGPDRIQDVSVGTGPFVQRQWTPGKRGVVEAVPDKWL